MTDICVVEALRMTLNSEEEVRGASWRGNRAGLGVDSRRIPPNRERREHDMYWEPYRAWESTRHQACKWETRCWGRQGWTTESSCLDTDFSSETRRSHWRSLWTFWQNIWETEAGSQSGSCACKLAEILRQLTKTGEAQRGRQQGPRLWSRPTSPLSTCVTLSRFHNLCACFLSCEMVTEVVCASLGYLLYRKCITKW